MNSAKQIAVLKSLTQQAAAHLLSRSSKWLRDEVAPRNPDSTYDAPTLVTWMIARAAGGAAGGDDPLMSPLPGESSRSPSLEKYRQERAREAKRKNDVAEGLLLDAAKVQAEVAAIGTSMRVSLEALARAYPDVERELMKALDDAEARFAEQFGKVKPKEGA